MSSRMMAVDAWIGRDEQLFAILEMGGDALGRKRDGVQAMVVGVVAPVSATNSWNRQHSGAAAQQFVQG